MTRDKPESPPVNSAAEDAPSADGAAFPIVGVGASAGGLEALQKLFKALPVDTGMAFVVVQHLAPDHASSLADLLARVTAMAVAVVSEGTVVGRNHVYVIPPGSDLILSGGKLRLLPQQQAGLHGIDRFFRSLAEDSEHLAVGVVLSGGLNDGTVGLVEIKAAGGVTFAQDESAQHESMPKSAITAGCVDYVLPPEGIALELARIARHPYVAEDSAGADGQPGHARVTEIVRRATGVDFTNYKASTLHRRITRRMMLHRLTAAGEYEELLRRTPAEIEELYQDILISVTNFFRNPDAYEALARDVFPKLITACAPGEPVRFWVIGCSSGEEAYALAMTFVECAEAARSPAQLQLFATDVNQRCVDKARAGLYPRSIAHDVSPERLRQFFVEEGSGYRIGKAIRERCVFSRHNALVDPPFLRMDFVSSRNLLIYLEPVLQQHIVPLFHYALKPGGWLWLGSSESVGTVRDLFDATDARHKIYSRRAGGRTPASRVQPTFSMLRTPEPAGLRGSAHGGLPRDAERLLLAKYAPPGVVVSAGLEIVQFQGDTGPYLAPAAGTASLHLLKMLREGLPTAVRDGLQQAEQSGAPVRLENLRVRSNGGFRTLAVEVIPVKAGAGGKGGGFVVLFDDANRPGAQAASRSSLGKWWQKLRASEAPPPGAQGEEILHLTQELAGTRETLQAAIEQHEAANEELQSANEEAQSANEEMQSIYEELENSKEEIEASNKELTALSEELASRNTDLHQLNEQLRQAIAASDAATWEWTPGEDRFNWTPEFRELHGFTAQEPGSFQSWRDRVHPADIGALLARLKTMLDTPGDDEWQVEFRIQHPQHGVRWLGGLGRVSRDSTGRAVAMRGINFDITARNHAAAALRESEERFRAIADNIPQLTWLANSERRVVWFNKVWLDYTGTTLEDNVGDGWKRVHHPDTVEAVAEKFERHLREGLDWEDTFPLRRHDGEFRWFLSRMTCIRDEAGKVMRFFGTNTDVTEWRQAEQLQAAQKEALEMAARGAPLLEVLTFLTRTAERESPANARMAIHLLDADEAHFTQTAAATLPPSYAQAADGLAVASRLGTCCACVLRRERVVVADIAASTEYPQFAAFALPLGLRAAWSTPVFSSTGKVLATFVCYYAEPREPGPQEDLLGEMVTRTAALLIERTQAEEKLRASEERYRSIIDSSPDCIKVLDLEGKLLALEAGQELLGITDLAPFLGRSWLDFWVREEDGAAARAAVAAAAAGGEAKFVAFFRTLHGQDKWWDVALSPVLDAEGRAERLLAVSRDVTEGRRTELNLAVLAAISQDLVRLAEIGEIMRTVGAKLGAHLGLSLCAFVEVNDAADEAVVAHDWHGEGARSFVGKYRLADFLSAEFQRASRAGETFIVRDTAADARTDAAAYAALGVGAFLASPLVREGRWRFSLAVTHAGPHDWRADEIELVREVTTRLWNRLERARVEEALRESHAELRRHAEEIEGFNRLMVGRELRMIELKREINALCAQHGQPPAYAVDAEGLGEEKETP